MPQVDLNISAGKDQVGEAWIWRLSRDYEIKVTLKKANVDSDFGWVQLELDGPVEEIQRATAWLMTTGMNVEAVQRAVGA